MKKHHKCNGRSLMCYYIEIEDLAANAMIEIMESSNMNCHRKISFTKLNAYGKKVVKLLKDKNQDAILINSRNATTSFRYEYKDYFKIEEDKKEIFISVGDEVTAEMLRKEFRAKLSVDLICAFSDQTSIHALID